LLKLKFRLHCWIFNTVKTVIVFSLRSQLFHFKKRSKDETIVCKCECFYELALIECFLVFFVIFFGSYETFWLNIDKVTDREQQGTNPLTNQPLTR
jgi:hypothetical protein